MPAAPHTSLFGSVIRSQHTCRTAASEHDYDGGLFAAPHVHDRSYLTIVRSGAVLEQFGGRAEELRPAQLQVMPAGEKHSNRYPVATRCLHLEIDAFVADLAAAGAPVSAGPRRDARALLLGRMIVDELQRGDTAAGLAVDGLLYALLARSTPELPRSAPPWLEVVTRALHDHLADGISLHDLGALAGVHPVHLSREFHHRTGRTVGAYLRELRVARACELLSGTTRTLADISLECGFFDQSHFTATFRRATGVTPARFRTLRAR